MSDQTNHRSQLPLQILCPDPQESFSVGIPGYHIAYIFLFFPVRFSVIPVIKTKSTANRKRSNYPSKEGLIKGLYLHLFFPVLPIRKLCQPIFLYHLPHPAVLVCPIRPKPIGYGRRHMPVMADFVFLIRCLFGFPQNFHIKNHIIQNL